MSYNNQGEPFLTEFKQFLGFLRNLWGILSGVSVFFPLSNVLFRVLPVHTTQDDPGGGWSYLSYSLITTITTIATLFVMLWTFGQRHQFKQEEATRVFVRKAWLSMVWSMVALVFYLGLHTTVYELFYAPLNITHGDPRCFIGDVFLLLSYAAFFACITRAFVLLAMREFYEM